MLKTSVVYNDSFGRNFEGAGVGKGVDGGAGSGACL